MSDALLIAILAAGASRRLGQPKQLVKLNGEPLLRRQSRIAIEAAIGPVTVILGCRADRCAATIADLPLVTRLNENWMEGMASTIRVAASAAIQTCAAGLLIVQCDQYRVTAADLQRLHAGWTETKTRSCRSHHGEYFGPPVIFPARCFDALLKLSGDEGARRVLANLAPNEIVSVDLPNAAYDLDLPSQLLAEVDCNGPTNART